jgi:ketosteroid isomerase-like protein
VRQQIEAVLMTFGDAFNKHDAAAIAALYTQNAIRLQSWWSEGDLASGQQAIKKWY